MLLVPVISVPVSLSWPRVAASSSSGRNFLAGAIITKYFRTYSTIILRREKILRDQGGALGLQGRRVDIQAKCHD